jgi:crotonobetainyl-CoA:carnitine CoA-transferase CaiB-like acyl-CoA transferase
MGSPAAGPLDGIRVLDFTRVLAGPHATRMLCDFGAEVIKLEPPSGDITRFTWPRVNGIATYYAQQNVGKRNISIDLSRPEGVELVARLADRCDVVIENFRAGVMDKLGLGAAALRERNPRLVYASVSGYGATGPLRHKMAYNVVIAAEAGMTKFQGDARGGVYESDPSDHADLYTAIEVAAAILAALVRRERTGDGDTIDLSMAHTVLYVNDHLHDQLFEGEVAPGSVRSFGTPDYVVLTVASGERLAVSGHPAERGTFELFARALGLEALLDDPDFSTGEQRLAHLSELKDRFRAAAAAIPDGATFEARFAAQRLASGIVQDARTLAESDWACHRGVLREIPDRAGGAIRIPSAPWRFGTAASGSTAGGSDLVRYRGEDNRAVLGDLLGLGDDELDRLEAGGVLSSRVPAPG